MCRTRGLGRRECNPAGQPWGTTWAVCNEWESLLVARGGFLVYQLRTSDVRRRTQKGNSGWLTNTLALSMGRTLSSDSPCQIVAGSSDPPRNIDRQSTEPIRITRLKASLSLVLTSIRLSSYP